MGARSAAPQWLRTVLAIGVGVVLLVVLLAHAGFDELHEQFDRLRWLAPLVLLPYLGVAVADVLSWRHTLPAAARSRIPFHVLFLARMAGEAVNSVTPTATLGGEPVKAQLLRAYGVSLSDGLASIVVAKTALMIAQSLFTALGFVGLFVVLGWTAVAALVFVVFAGVLTGMTYLLLHVQQRNPVTALWRGLVRLMPNGRFVQRLEEGAKSIDERLLSFYRSEPESFVKATTWSFLGWLFGVVEVQLMLTLLDHRISWLEAFVIEAVAQPIRAVAIIIPGGLGAQEWGGVVFCQTVLGMPEKVAATLWLLKRGRELVFDIVGLLYLSRRWSAGTLGG